MKFLITLLNFITIFQVHFPLRNSVTTYSLRVRNILWEYTSRSILIIMNIYYPFLNVLKILCLWHPWSTWEYSLCFHFTTLRSSDTLDSSGRYLSVPIWGGWIKVGPYNPPDTEETWWSGFYLMQYLMFTIISYYFPLFLDRSHSFRFKHLDISINIYGGGFLFLTLCLSYDFLQVIFYWPVGVFFHLEIFYLGHTELIYF